MVWSGLAGHFSAGFAQCLQHMVEQEKCRELGWLAEGMRRLRSDQIAAHNSFRGNSKAELSLSLECCSPVAKRSVLLSV